MEQHVALEKSLDLAAVTTMTRDICVLIEQAHGFCLDLSRMIYDARNNPKRRARLLHTLDYATVRYMRRIVLAGFQNGGPRK